MTTEELKDIEFRMALVAIRMRWLRLQNGAR